MKCLIIFLILFKTIQSQIIFNDLINQTKEFSKHEIEKFGDKAVNKIQDFFGFGVRGDESNDVGGVINNATSPAVNVTQLNNDDIAKNNKTFNKTLSSMPNGVCTMEVPTASLIEGDNQDIKGNGSDPTLSRIQVCCEGYQRNALNFRKCDPICQDGCDNGVCVGPNQCLCFPNFVRNLAGKCVETCPKSCENGFCDGDGKCSCNDGFQPAGGTDALFCVPKCSQSCSAHANCTAPDTCTCLKGYTMTSEGQCEPVCDGGCTNGICSKPNVCECNKGFVRNNGICLPNCSKGCKNGDCVGPEVCKCSGNLKLDITGTECVGSCEKSCLNGVCSGPNECTCKAGYFPDNYDKFRCVPKCTPHCINSICSGPNLCLCYQGYVKDRATPGNYKCVKV